MMLVKFNWSDPLWNTEAHPVIACILKLTHPIEISSDTTLSILSLSLCPSPFLTHLIFTGPVCVLQSRLWPGNEVTLAFLPAASMYFGYSTERNRDCASGRLVLFHFTNISLCLVLLQLRSITTVQKITAAISVVLETVELIEHTWPKDSSHTWAATFAFSLKMFQTALF